MRSSKICRYESVIFGTPEFIEHHANCVALYVTYTTAIENVKQTPDLLRKEPLTYEQCRAALDDKDWILACDLEMTKLRDLGCWKVVDKSLPADTHLMGSR